MMMSVTVRLDRFGQEALEDYVRGSGESHEDALDVAVRYYLADSDSGRVAWRVPRHHGEMDSGEPLELKIDAKLLGALRREARRQEVSTDLLALHALMYYLADLDSGRAAARLGDAINRDAEAN
jgi:hypothetical protein